VKHHVLFFLISFFSCSYSMYNRLLPQSTNPNVITLNKNQVTFIRHYIMNSSIRPEHKIFLSSRLKPRTKRKV